MSKLINEVREAKLNVGEVVRELAVIANAPGPNREWAVKLLPIMGRLLWADQAAISMKLSESPHFPEEQRALLRRRLGKDMEEWWERALKTRQPSLGRNPSKIHVMRGLLQKMVDGSMRTEQYEQLIIAFWHAFDIEAAMNPALVELIKEENEPDVPLLPFTEKSHHEYSGSTCTRCNCSSEFPTTECSGVNLTEQQAGHVKTGRIDFHNGKWWRRSPADLVSWTEMEPGERFE